MNARTRWAARLVRGVLPVALMGGLVWGGPASSAVAITSQTLTLPGGRPLW